MVGIYPGVYRFHIFRTVEHDHYHAMIIIYDVRIYAVISGAADKIHDRRQVVVFQGALCECTECFAGIQTRLLPVAEIVIVNGFSVCTGFFCYPPAASSGNSDRKRFFCLHRICLRRLPTRENLRQISAVYRMLKLWKIPPLPLRRSELPPSGCWIVFSAHKKPL